MAMVHGADVEKALIAGMLHDCGKAMSHDDQVKLCEKNKIELSDVEKRNHSLIIKFTWLVNKREIILLYILKLDVILQRQNII